jgi:hypothetical protein
MRSITCLFTLIFALSAYSADQTLQTDRWISHLTRYEATHSELTDEQRSILLQGRDLLAAGLLRQLRSSDTREAADAHRVLDAFKARASNAFSRDAYAEAFIRLGRAPRTAVSMVPECDCNASTGECGGECVTGSCRAMPEGCGTFGTDACFGLCS